MTEKLSEHFTRAELACKCGCGLCNVAQELLTLAEKVRALLGDTPMIVHSACRCAAHNKAVGGTASSKHLTGQAMDFHAGRLKNAGVAAAIRAAYNRGELPELGGLGLYDTFVHIDTAKAADGHLRYWDYRTTQDKVASG